MKNCPLLIGCFQDFQWYYSIFAREVLVMSVCTLKRYHRRRNSHQVVVHQTQTETRMHSSRMRTTPLLTVFCSIWGGGLPKPPGSRPLSWSCDQWCMLGSHPPLSPVNRMTYRCKNITLPKTSFASGKYSVMLGSSSEVQNRGISHSAKWLHVDDPTRQRTGPKNVNLFIYSTIKVNILFLLLSTKKKMWEPLYHPHILLFAIVSQQVSRNHTIK